VKVVAASISPLQFATATIKLENPNWQIAESMADGATKVASVSATRRALKLPTAKPHTPSTRLLLSAVAFVPNLHKFARIQPSQASTPTTVSVSADCMQMIALE